MDPNFVNLSQEKFLETLKVASYDNDATTFQKTADENPDKNVWTRLGDFGTPFHYALYKGTLEGETLEFFLYLLTQLKRREEQEQEEEEEEGRGGFKKNLKFIKKFLNQKNTDGNTVLHLAAYCESDELAKLLFHNGASLYIRNKKKYSALELMYAKTPGAVVSILDESFKLVNERKVLGDKPRGQQRNLYIDFGPIVGKTVDHTILLEEEPGSAPFLTTDTSLLASLVRQQSESSEVILGHVLTKIFLDLKWKKLSVPVYASAAFYILIHLWYTLFVIQVFIVSFPHGHNQNVASNLYNSNSGGGNNESEFFPNQNGRHGIPFHQYLWGQYGHFWEGIFPSLTTSRMTTSQSGASTPILLWAPSTSFRLAAMVLLLLELLELYVVSHVKVMGRSEWESKKDVPWETFTAILLILIAHLTHVTTLTIFGAFFVLLQLLRVALSSRRETKVWMRRKVTRRDDNFFARLAKVIVNGLTIYLNSSENILLLIFLSYMIHVPGVNLDGSPIPPFYYVNAAFSVVLAWALILLQFGSVFGLGRYVEMLKTVLGAFVKMTLTYFAIYVAFCVAFSILFPEDGLFETLPLSLFRVLTMMGGELGVEELLGGDRDIYDGDPTLTPFPIARHLLYASFIVIVAIVMFNLLLGLTVENLEKISENSAARYTTTRVERLYAMEAIFNLIGKFVMDPINKLRRRRRRRVTRRDDLLNGSLVNGSSEECQILFSSLPLHRQLEVRRVLGETGRKEIGRR